MSLDVTLRMADDQIHHEKPQDDPSPEVTSVSDLLVYIGNYATSIYVRDGGQTRPLADLDVDAWAEHISYWLTNRIIPSRIVSTTDKTSSMHFDANITHNLGKMASAAGIYDCVWHPNENGITKAAQLIEPLIGGIKRLKDNPEHFKKFEPANKWGTYDAFVPWLERYLEACKRMPEADVTTSV